MHVRAVLLDYLLGDENGIIRSEILFFAMNAKNNYSTRNICKVYNTFEYSIFCSSLRMSILNYAALVFYGPGVYCESLLIVRQDSIRATESRKWRGGAESNAQREDETTSTTTSAERRRRVQRRAQRSDDERERGEETNSAM